MLKTCPRDAQASTEVKLNLLAVLSNVWRAHMARKARDSATPTHLQVPDDDRGRAGLLAGRPWELAYRVVCEQSCTLGSAGCCSGAFSGTSCPQTTLARPDHKADAAVVNMSCELIDARR